MTISEKIFALRKQHKFTQEYLSELCNVSRQSVSKWESGVIYPEIDKIILLSTIFKTSVDTLVKDELSIDCPLFNDTCHCNAETQNLGANYYEGIIIKESLLDENILNLLNVTKVELWRTESTPKYWTALYFNSNILNFPDLLSHAICESDNWYVDFKCNNIKYIVFHNRVLKYTIGNSAEKEQVIYRCKEFGIPDNQLNWPE